MEFLTDLWQFLMERKKWWLLPMFIVLVLVGALIALSSSSAVAPFIYTLFQQMENAQSDRLEYLKVTATVAMILLGIVAFGKYYKGSSALFFDILFGIAFVLLFGSIISAKFAELFTKGWTALGHAMGYVMSRVILTSIFFFFLTPIALLYRLTHKNPLKLKKEGLDTYYVTRDHKYLPEDLDKMW